MSLIFAAGGDAPDREFPSWRAVAAHVLDLRRAIDPRADIRVGQARLYRDALPDCACLTVSLLTSPAQTLGVVMAATGGKPLVAQAFQGRLLDALDAVETERAAAHNRRVAA